MKGHKIPDETRKIIYDRIAAGDKIADIAADTGVAASTLRTMRQQADKIPDTDPEAKTVRFVESGYEFEILEEEKISSL